MDKMTSEVPEVPKVAKVPAGLLRSRAGVAAALIGSSLCIGSCVLAANTVALDAMRFMQRAAKKNGTVIEPAPKLRNLLEQAASDLKLSNSERKSVRLFCTQSDVAEIFGTVKYPFGALLGVPEVANADSVEDLNLAVELECETKSESIKIEKLKKTLVLSDAAKLYVIAEGLLLARDAEHFINPAINSSLATFGAGLQTGMMCLYLARLRPFTYLIYFACFWGWVGLSLLLSESNREDLLKEKMANLSEVYVDGGIEFYEKLKMRQQLMNDLFGTEVVNVFGNCYVEDLVGRRLSTLRKMREEASWLS